MYWSVQAADQQPRATYASPASQARTVTVEGRRVRVLVEEANSPDQVLLDFIKYFNFDYDVNGGLLVWIHYTSSFLLTFDIQ